MTADLTAKRALERFLGERHRFTVAEAAAATGLAIDSAHSALEGLLERYVCRLQVTEHGELIYDFGDQLHRRGERSLRERVDTLLSWAWRAFKAVFRLWIAGMLVIYFGLFVLFVLASLSTGVGRDLGRAVDLDDLAHMFRSIFRRRTHSGSTDRRTDGRGYSYPHYRPTPTRRDGEGKGFVAAVYDFVFGPERVPIDPLTNEKEVAAYLRRERGVIVHGELESLAGWTARQAEEFFTDTLVRFRGDVKVSPEGVVYGQFDEVLRGVAAADEGHIIHYWDEYEPEYELTGNSNEHNTWIVLMNGFILLSAVRFASSVVLGLVPLAFSTVFFVVPGLRWLVIRSARKRRQVVNVRKRIYAAIFAAPDTPRTLEQIVATVNRKQGVERLTASDVEPVLDRCTIDLGGEPRVGEDGALRYVYPRIAEELEVIARLRSERSTATGLGMVIVDSDREMTEH